MRQPKTEAQRWLAQARSDLGFTELGLREGYHAQTCELLDGLIARHPHLAGLREAAQQLDQFYVPTRYPNGLPGGVPAQVFTHSQAARAVSDARRFVESAETLAG